MKEWGGKHWVRDSKRLAIYKRDRFSCSYCGASGVPLSLDHVKPRSRGGSNDAFNLVTTCTRCNFSRQDKPVLAFAKILEAKLGLSSAEIVARVQRRRRRKLTGS